MESLIEQLRDKGIRLEVQGGSLRVHASRGALTREVRELLRKHSAELARELRRRDQQTSAAHTDVSVNAEGERLTVEALVELIREQLKDRPLPIVITSGETVVNLGRYVQAEARALVAGCTLEAEAARARLARLGIPDF